MAKDFWFKFYFKDWADDVKPLSLGAKGLLIELIIELRKRGGEMPVDVNLISRLSGGLTEQITEHLTEFRASDIFDFELRGTSEFLISRKIKNEIAISLKNSQNGKLGGSPLLKPLKPSVNPKPKREDNRAPNSIFNSNSDSNNEFEKKKKPKKSEFVPPELNEVEVFFQANGFSRELGEKAWMYYADADWKDSKGNKVLNWKQKMRGVWFKDENKNNGQQQQTNRKNTGGGFTDQELLDAVARHHGIDNFGTQEPR